MRGQTLSTSSNLCFAQYIRKMMNSIEGINENDMLCYIAAASCASTVLPPVPPPHVCAAACCNPSCPHHTATYRVTIVCPATAHCHPSCCFSNSCFFMSQNVLVYLHFLSHMSHTLPSESHSSSPLSVRDSGAVVDCEVGWDCWAIGSYLELPHIDSVGEQQGTLPCKFSPNDITTPAVDATGLTPTFTPVLLVWGDQISWNEVNGCIDDACDKWDNVVVAELALTLVLNCKELSCGLLSELEVGEVGKGGL